MSPSANQSQEVPTDALSLQDEYAGRSRFASSSPAGGEGGPGRSSSPGAGRRARRRPPKFYRIGELVDYCGMSRQTIHNYTTMGLLQESRWTHGGHRLYDESAFDDLDLIAEMKAQNYSMEYIREHFAKLDRPAPDGRPPDGSGEN